MVIHSCVVYAIWICGTLKINIFRSFINISAIKGREIYVKMTSAAQGSWEKKKEMRDAAFKANSENNEIPAQPLVSVGWLLSFYTPHIMERRGWNTYPFYVNRKPHKKLLTRSKFAEESIISSLQVPILLPALPRCFSCVTLFSKFVPRLLNSLLCSPGPSLLNPRHQSESSSLPLSCLPISGPL